MRHVWAHKLDVRGPAGSSVCRRCGERRQWAHQLGAPVGGGPCNGVWTMQHPHTKVGDMPRRPAPTPTAKFIGGPLDGETFVKDFGGRWSLYLQNDGSHLAAREGDRLTRVGRPDGCYVHREEQQDDGTWVHVYRHSTTLPQRTTT